MKSKNQTVEHLISDAKILMKAVGFSVNGIQVITQEKGYENDENYYTLSSVTQRHFYAAIKKVLDENLDTIVKKTLAEIAQKLGEEQTREEAIIHETFREISHKLHFQFESSGAQVMNQAFSESGPKQTDLTSEVIDDAMRELLNEQTKGEKE